MTTLAVDAPDWLRGSRVLALVARTSAAQSVPAADNPGVVPPHLKSDPGVAYPRRALEEHVVADVTVDLVLEIAPDGTVRRATVIEPRGHGFDEAAIAAASSLVFEPATRDGKPIAARIRFRYDIRPPAPRLVGRVATASTDRPIGGAAVVIHDSAGAEHRATTRPDGTWSMLDLPAGAVRGGDPGSISGSAKRSKRPISARRRPLAITTIKPWS